MYDRELVLEILTQIYESTHTILKRFEPVKSVEDLPGSDAGMGELDVNSAFSVLNSAQSI